MITVRGVENVPIDEMEMNELSANIEDQATYERLKDELRQTGMIELPIVLAKGDGGYRIIAGHHRIRAWADLKHATSPCVVIEGEMTPEEEFNLVNNLNLVRGTPTLTEIKRVIRAQRLDVEKVDLHKIPVAKLVPSVSGVKDGEMSRKAKIMNMVLRIAPKIAQAILESADDEVVVFVRVEDKPVAVVTVPLKVQDARKMMPVFVRAVETMCQNM